MCGGRTLASDRKQTEVGKWGESSPPGTVTKPRGSNFRVPRLPPAEGGRVPFSALPRPVLASSCRQVPSWCVNHCVNSAQSAAMGGGVCSEQMMPFSNARHPLIFLREALLIAIHKAEESPCPFLLSWSPPPPW